MKPVSTQVRPLLKPILAGGLIAGTLDMTAALILYGWAVPRAIAAALLGRHALEGGVGVWVLGILLHYSVAFSAAAVYCFASLRLDFMKRHFVVCGMFYGIAVYLVMNFIVLPVSALHSAGPYKLYVLIQGLLIHMLIIGLPIAFSLRKFSR